jgi:predicted PurR-regulated permease PerM
VVLYNLVRVVQAVKLPVRQRANTWFLLTLAALALYLSYLVAKPFLNSILAAVVLAITFYPLHARIISLVSRPNLAATISTLLVMLVVAIPAVFLSAVVTSELADLYQSLSEKSAAQGGLSAYFMHLLEAPLRLVGRYLDVSRIDLRSTLLGWVEQVSRYMVGIGGRAVSNLVSLMLGIVVIFFTLFFLFRDGVWIRQRIAALLPLTHEQARRLIARISETVVASVYGGVAVALAQGLLTGLAFWLLGLSSPVVWGLVASLASLVPVIGTGMVWGPAAVVLIMSGHWIKALILFGWGAAVVAQVDALVRPYVVSERAKMHNLLIFFALLGGVRAFGIMGIFIGPVVVSVTIALLDMLSQISVSSQESE